MDIINATSCNDISIWKLKFQQNENIYTAKHCSTHVRRILYLYIK